MNHDLSTQALTSKTHHEYKQAGGEKKLECKMQQTCNIYLLASVGAGEVRNGVGALAPPWSSMPPNSVFCRPEMVIRHHRRGEGALALPSIIFAPHSWGNRQSHEH